MKHHNDLIYLYHWHYFAIEMHSTVVSFKIILDFLSGHKKLSQRCYNDGSRSWIFVFYYLKMKIETTWYYEFETTLGVQQCSYVVFQHSMDVGIQPYFNVIDCFSIRCFNQFFSWILQMISNMSLSNNMLAISSQATWLVIRIFFTQSLPFPFRSLGRLLTNLPWQHPYVENQLD